MLPFHHIAMSSLHSTTTPYLHPIVGQPMQFYSYLIIHLMETIQPQHLENNKDKYLELCSETY